MTRPARGRRSWGRPGASRGVGLLVVLLAGLSGALLPGPVVGDGDARAAAPGPPGSTRAGQTAEADRPPLQLLAQDPWVEAGEPFALEVAAPDAPEGATLLVAVHDAVGSRSAFAFTLTGEALGGSTYEAGPLPIDLLDPGPDGSVELEVPTGPAGADVDGEGVYPVDVLLAEADGTPLHRLVTHLVVLPGPDSLAPPLSVATIVPFDASPLLESSGEVVVDDQARVQLGTTANALTRYDDVALTVDPTPETVDSLSRADGGEPDPLLDQLAGAMDGRQLLAGTYVELDLAAWVAAGMRDELGEQAAAGGDAVEGGLGLRPDPRTWVLDGPTTGATLDRLRELGADQIVLPQSALLPLDAQAFPVALTQPFEVATPSGALQLAASADSALLAHLGSTGDPVLDAHHLLADLSVLYFDRPANTRGVPLPLPTGAEVPGPFLEALLEGLGASEGVLEPVTLDDLFAGVAVADAGGDLEATGSPLVRSLAAAEPADLGSYPDELALTELAIEGYGSLLGPDEAPVAAAGRLALTSGDRALGADGRRRYLSEVSARIDTTLAAVEAPTDQTITLTSRRGTIPLRLRNANEDPVAVMVRLESERLDFPEGETIAVTLPPGETGIDVEVETRASGAFPLEVEVVSPDQILDVANTEYQVRSTALSGVGIVLLVGAGLILLVWWLRHFRNLRRNRALVTPHPSRPPPPVEA